MPQVLLMNPNSHVATTAAMVTIAQRYIPNTEGWTARGGPDLLATMELLAASALQVEAADIPARFDGVIVAAFGDPGRAALCARLNIPVVGIGESAALAASKDGRPYAVVTHTPALVTGIDALMRSSAPEGTYLGTFLTKGDPHALGADPDALDAALLTATHNAHAAGAEAVIIGGGPLGEAADRLYNSTPCALIAPIPEAARRLLYILQDDA